MLGRISDPRRFGQIFKRRPAASWFLLVAFMLLAFLPSGPAPAQTAPDSALGGVSFPDPAKDWSGDADGSKASEIELAAAFASRSCTKSREFFTWPARDVNAANAIREHAEQAFTAAGWTFTLISRNDDGRRVTLASRSGSDLVMTWVPANQAIGLVLCAAERLPDPNPPPVVAQASPPAAPPVGAAPDASLAPPPAAAPPPPAADTTTPPPAPPSADATTAPAPDNTQSDVPAAKGDREVPAAPAQGQTPGQGQDQAQGQAGSPPAVSPPPAAGPPPATDTPPPAAATPPPAPETQPSAAAPPPLEPSPPAPAAAPATTPAAAAARDPWLGFLAWIVAALLAAGGAILIVRTLRSRQDESEVAWPTTTAKVLDSYVVEREEEHRGELQTVYAPVVVYRYEVDGSAYEGQQVRLPEYSEPNFEAAEVVARRYPTGAEIDVRYHPFDPTSATIETEKRALEATLFIGAACVVAAAAAVVFALMG